MKRRLSYGGCSRWSRMKPTKSRQQSVKSSKLLLPLLDTPLFFFFFSSPARDLSLSIQEKRESDSKLFCERQTDGEGRGCVRWRQSLERNCRFPVLRVLATRNVEEAAPGIATSAAHNPAVMAFDSCDCSDNYTGDRAAFFAKSSSYKRQLQRR